MRSIVSRRAVLTVAMGLLIALSATGVSHAVPMPYNGTDLRLWLRADAGLTADCTGLEIDPDTGYLLQTRPAFGGNVMATIRTKNSKSQMATARPGVMKRIPADPARKGKVVKHKVELTEDDVSLEIIKTEMGRGEVNLDAEAIVAGARDRGAFSALPSVRQAAACRISYSAQQDKDILIPVSAPLR